MSHPTWVRELKLFYLRKRHICTQSHPTWVRELKRENCQTLPHSSGRTLRGCVN